MIRPPLWNPGENAIAERVNGILKTEWLNHKHFEGFMDAHAKIAQVIAVFNNKRPHLSLNYATPDKAYMMEGVQTMK